MRSGNGRHRRPRQAPAIFVTVGVTGAGMALPLFAASGAQAADTGTWDKVAQCESGGMWSAATGNGFYGGLQLTQDMWEQYGGTAYASRPDLASRSQQIAVAESILDDRGPDAWPSCAVNAGLTRDGRAPEVDPGSTSTPRPDPAGDPGGRGNSDGRGDSGDQGDSGDWGDPADSGVSTDPGDPSADPSADPSGPSSDPSDDSSGDPSADPSDDSSGDPSGDPSGDATPTPSPSAPDASDSADPSDPASTPAPGTGKHRGGADEDKDGSHRESGEGGEDGKGDGADGRPSGRHASRGGDAHRTEPGTDPGADYTVRSGDTLSGIAEAHDLPGGWTALYDRNEKVIGSDADLIHPGQRLDLGHAEG